MKKTSSKHPILLTSPAKYLQTNIPHFASNGPPATPYPELLVTVVFVVVSLLTRSGQVAAANTTAANADTSKFSAEEDTVAGKTAG